MVVVRLLCRLWDGPECKNWGVRPVFFFVLRGFLKGLEILGLTWGVPVSPQRDWDYEMGLGLALKRIGTGTRSGWRRDWNWDWASKGLGLRGGVKGSD